MTERPSALLTLLTQLVQLFCLSGVRIPSADFYPNSSECYVGSSWCWKLRTHASCAVRRVCHLSLPCGPSSSLWLHVLFWSFCDLDGLPLCCSRDPSFTRRMIWLRVLMQLYFRVLIKSSKFGNAASNERWSICKLLFFEEHLCILVLLMFLLRCIFLLLFFGDGQKLP